MWTNLNSPEERKDMISRMYTCMEASPGRVQRSLFNSWSQGVRRVMENKLSHGNLKTLKVLKNNKAMIIYIDMKDFFSIMTSEVKYKINLPVGIPPPPEKPHSNALLYIKKSIINDCIHTCMARQKSLRSCEVT